MEVAMPASGQRVCNSTANEISWILKIEPPVQGSLPPALAEHNLHYKNNQISNHFKDLFLRFFPGSFLTNFGKP
jgi:hypothetical protein